MNPDPGTPRHITANPWLRIEHNAENWPSPDRPKLGPKLVASDSPRPPAARRRLIGDSAR